MSLSKDWNIYDIYKSIKGNWDTICRKLHPCLLYVHILKYENLHVNQLFESLFISQTSIHILLIRKIYNRWSQLVFIVIQFFIIWNFDKFFVYHLTNYKLCKVLWGNLHQKILFVLDISVFSWSQRRSSLKQEKFFIFCLSIFSFEVEVTCDVIFTYYTKVKCHWE